MNDFLTGRKDKSGDFTLHIAIDRKLYEAGEDCLTILKAAGDIAGISWFHIDNEEAGIGLFDMLGFNVEECPIDMHLPDDTTEFVVTGFMQFDPPDDSYFDWREIVPVNPPLSVALKAEKRIGALEMALQDAHCDVDKLKTELEEWRGARRAMGFDTADPLDLLTKFREHHDAHHERERDLLKYTRHSGWCGLHQGRSGCTCGLSELKSKIT